MENITTKKNEDFAELISSEKITIVDFWAEWCGPCTMQLPILEDFGKRNADIQIIKINVDSDADLAKEYGIRNIPTLLFFQNSEVKNKSVGLQTTNKLDEIVNNIKNESND